MRLFTPAPEPPDFKVKCQQPGEAWLAAHPKAGRPSRNRRLKDYWSPFRPHLADAFQQLCGYMVMYDPTGGTVDHYISCGSDESKAYLWSNYRFAMQWVNSSKGTLDERVIDPFELDDEWLEVLLPSMQLVVSNAAPPEVRKRLEYTLERLRLRDDERAIRPRREWYRMYQAGEITVEGLRKKAPLIARAVEKAMSGERD